MKYSAFIFILLATPAVAADITVTLTDAQQNIIVQALDRYLKAEGVSVVLNAASIIVLMRDASPAATKPEPPAEKD